METWMLATIAAMAAAVVAQTLVLLVAAGSSKHPTGVF